ncbi:MAG: hypothetical protein K0Q49_1229 [Haloplasmataceae bacterium]|nr:hypothetical protein [Haloplasmataceae bacterium]
MENGLYVKLHELRENIKTEGKSKRKKQDENIIVCNDDVLESIVSLLPESVEDFKKIRGIGDSFVEKYAQKFLDVVNEYVKEKYAYLDANAKELEILNKLSNKLININQKNRLLYTSHLTNKKAFDLTRIDDRRVEKIIEAFINEDASKSFVIAKVSYEKSRTSKTVDNFNAVKTLYREVESIRVEKGLEVLYLGYPYVEGKLFYEDFKIKSPICLFPAKIDVINNEYRLSFDKNRDIIYNTSLIIANNSFNNKNEVISEATIEEVKKIDMIQNAVSFFGNHNVKIKNERGLKLEEFNDIMPTYEDGKLHLKGYCVLGSFPNFSNSIQKDYYDIINNKVISNLVRNLFVGIDDIKDNNIRLINEGKDWITNNKDVDENTLFYINQLNYSQEKVLDEINKKDALVIQGPPGTGKSQTITSLISQAVMQHKKVLVISEKKTALDVIYNRLGKIANFVMYIDDPNNKEEFYSQLLSLLELDDDLVLSKNKIDEIATEIDNELTKLNALETLLNTETQLKSSLRELYQNSKKIDLNNSDVEKLFKELHNKKIDFSLEQLLRYKALFNEEELISKLLEYKDSLKYTSIYKLFKTNIKETDLYIPTKDNYEIPFFIELYSKFDFITKFRLNRKNKELVKKIKQITLNIGGKNKKKIKSEMYEDINFFMESLKYYNKYKHDKNIYDTLSSLERTYFELCFNLSSKLKLDFQFVNHLLIDILTTVEIQKYESKYQQVLITTERFSDIRQRISELVNEKEKLTFDCMFNLLQVNISKVFTESKRLNELKRKCESKRRWSINKLMNEFSLELFNSINVWLLTPEGVSELLPLKENLFDLIIFDEASQMFIENAIPILYRGKKAVIAGDSKQLRPSKFGTSKIDSEDIDYDEYSGVLEEDSLLDLAKHRYPEVMLNYHYRSKYEELIAFSNYAFYEGKLTVCPNPTETKIKPIERIKVDGKWIDRKNEVEANEVINLLSKIFAERRHDETIGVITFNINQKDLIMDKIEQECLKSPEFNNVIVSEKLRDAKDQLFVKNIENVQGDERDIIIFSIGYAPNEQNRVIRQFGWLNMEGGENRLNVAISRAKQKIYVVTSIEPHELHVEELKSTGPKLLKSYLDYVKAVSNGDNSTAEKILRSLYEPADSISSDDLNSFAENVYQELTNIGFQVDKQVGIGTNKINLAIRDTVSNKYMLGIELDLYNRNQNSTKEIDYHRQKYLESHGWTIHRIWSSDWWRSKDKEINKIINMMNKLIENLE